MNVEIKVPDGESGPWKVETFVVSEEDAARFNMRAMFHPGCRTIEPGTYKKLTRNGSIIMSNTPAEISDHLTFIYRARRWGGDILINGLGLGVALTAILEREHCIYITVIEQSEDVIKLVAPTFADDPRISIIHADAFTYKPEKGKRFTCVWHDIWDNICADNLPEMTKLHRKYGSKTDWQGSWCKHLCKRYA